jgi:1-acyl-sn-glycerol-3-phosphate acyltransferase
MLYAFVLNLRAFIMIIHTLVWTAIGIVVMVINPTGQLYMWLARVGWAKQVMLLGGMPLSVKGLHNITPKQSYIICANHQSLLDIPTLFAGLPIPIRFVAKKSLFYLPIFGWSMWLAGFVPITRGAGKKARDSLRRAVQRVKHGRSVILFPEGTRSPDGQIKSFKSGAFIMAIEAGLPVLPVIIKGTYEAGPRQAIRVYPHPVELIIGEPISTSGLNPKERYELRERTREKMLEIRG